MSQEARLPGENGGLTASPTPHFLSQRVIRRQFLFDTLQEKTVLLPFAVSVLGLVYLVLYAPLLGGGFIVGIVSLIAGLLGMASLVWQAGVHYQQGYTRKLQELAAQFETQNAQQTEARLLEVYTGLEHGFQEIQGQEGLKILRGLEHEYRQLQPVIAQGAEADLLSASNLSALVRETYIQGLNILEHALDLERAIGSDHNKRLQDEIRSLEQKAAEVAQNSDGGDNLTLIEEKIDFNKERLTMVKKLRLRVEELLYQAERCEASLSKTRIELAELKADASDASVISVISTLEKTIERAKEIQVELKKLGY